jgi:hypothetical protein
LIEPYRFADAKVRRSRTFLDGSGSVKTATGVLVTGNLPTRAADRTALGLLLVMAPLV